MVNVGFNNKFLLLTFQRNFIFQAFLFTMLSFFKGEEKIFEIYETPKCGFYLKSEIINGRLAMVVFPIIIIIELLTKQPILKVFNLGD